jgi:hypothetical protein
MLTVLCSQNERERRASSHTKEVVVDLGKTMSPSFPFAAWTLRIENQKKKFHYSGLWLTWVELQTFLFRFHLDIMKWKKKDKSK